MSLSIHVITIINKYGSKGHPCLIPEDQFSSLTFQTGYLRRKLRFVFDEVLVNSNLSSALHKQWWSNSSNVFRSLKCK